MMRKIVYSFIAACLLTASCAKEADAPLKYGTLSITLAGDPSFDVTTKAPVKLEQSSEEAAGYTVRIYNDENVKKYEAPYSKFVPQTLRLGTYYVTAENCTEKEAEEGNGMMRLYGRSQNVTLSATKPEDAAEISCTVSNAKVAVVYDDSVAGLFDGLTTVLSKTGRTVEVPEAASGTEIWFNPSEITYTISGIFNATGNKVSLSAPLSLEAKDNIKLMVKVNLSSGQIQVPTIQVDAEIAKPEEIEEEFNPYK